VHGRLLLDEGVVTVVDEAKLRDRFAQAVSERVYRSSPEVRRWAELGGLVEPYVLDFYRDWYGVPVEPAHVYNARTAPPPAERRS
jgi:hypothetical protein